MAKISLNSHVNSFSGGSWTLQTINGIKYFVSNNKTSSSVSSIKCSFTTPYDNINVVVEIGSSSENNYDWCYIGKLDDSDAAHYNYLDRISGIINNGPKFKTVTINVAKAGTHFLIIGYQKDNSSNAGNDCGYFRLVTTEVDSLKPDPYIYCGTKTVVSEEPIKFTKTNISNGNNGNRNWIDYQGTSKDYLWEANVGDDNSLKTAKISFTTSNDNVTIILKYSIILRGGIFSVSNLDSNENNNMIYKRGDGVYETITKEITVPKAGEHFIWICYDEGSFAASIYVGFFGTNVVTNTRILVPERILANNRNIGKVYVGSELIWSKPLNNTISWETLTWDKSNNSYTYNTKGKLYISYSYDNNNYETYLLSSPASVPHPDEITKVKFYNINSYQGNSYNCTYKLDLSWVNTYKFNSTYNMFNNCYSLTKLDVSNFNTSNVTNMWNMFYNCSSLTSLDVSKWDTSKVTSIGNIFHNCSSLTSLDVSKWNTSKVTDMSWMFSGCNNLTSLDVSKWNTSNVTNMYTMFYNCPSITSLDVSKWNTSKVTNMQFMFSNCNNLTKLDLSKWDVSNVTNIDNIFYNSSSLTTLIDGNESDSYIKALNKLKVNIDLNPCVKLNYESVYALFRGVATVTGKTITLPSVMKGKLDATKVNIATNKGWTVRYN